MHIDWNSLLETQENQTEETVQKTSRFNCPPTRSFPYALKPPKVYATRDFPDLCVALASQVNANRNEDSINVATDENCNVANANRNVPDLCVALASQVNANRNEDSINVATDENCNVANANRVVGTPTKRLRSIKGEPAKSLASGSRTYDMEHKMNVHLSVVPPPSITVKEEEKMAAPLNSFKKAKRLASIKSADGSDDAALGRNVEPKDSHKEINGKKKVKETLKSFQDLYKQLSDEHIEGTSGRRFDINAAELLKKQGKWIHPDKCFGHIPGISIGDQFHYRAELAVVGLHCQYMGGIDCKKRNGKKLAISIVDSGYYDNKSKSADVLIYCGQGGHKGWSSGSDQMLTKGNLALANSIKERNPVRVIKKKSLDRDSISYTYDGLYIVNKYWTEKDDKGKLVYKFELLRRSSQEGPSQAIGGESRNVSFKECCVMDDVSRGKEDKPIRVMNGIDGERPLPFAYTTNMRYPQWCKQMSPHKRGCGCTNDCSNSKPCLCVVKNGGQNMFNEKGVILGGRDIIYECGPLCKCPSTCMNRVSQHGPRYKLELYKIGARQMWGVRSPNFISSGSFVCEFVGDLKEIEEDGRVMGLRIDASKVGNVGRFVKNSSSSPNLFVQRVLYDREDNRVPHIMLFAAKGIRPLQGFSCDFSHHRMDQVAEFQYQLRL